MQRVYSIDFIKCFAIFAVVLIHTYPKDNELGLFLNTLSKFAVPFFFAASGYLLGQKMLNNPSRSAYAKNNIMKLLKIYGCWLAFYITYDICITALTNVMNGFPIKQSLVNYFSDGFNPLSIIYYGTSSSGYQLWFLPALIWSTILLLIFHKFKQIKFLLAGSLILNLIGLFGQSYSGIWGISLPVDTRDALFFGLFYTTLGFFFAQNIQSIKLTSPKTTYIGLIIGFIILQNIERSLLGVLSNYFLSTLFLTVVLFLFVINNKSLGQGSFLSKIGANSLGIYVIHVFFINLVNLCMTTFGLIAIKETILFQIAFTPAVFIISYFAYDTVQYIKQWLFKAGSRAKIRNPKTA